MRKKLKTNVWTNKNKIKQKVKNPIQKKLGKNKNGRKVRVNILFEEAKIYLRGEKTSETNSQRENFDPIQIGKLIKNTFDKEDYLSNRNLKQKE